MCRAAYLIMFLVLSFLEPSKSDINIEEGQQVAGGNFLSKAALQDEVEIFELDGRG